MRLPAFVTFVALGLLGLACSATVVPATGNEDTSAACNPGQTCACDGNGNCNRACTGKGCVFDCNGNGSCNPTCDQGGCTVNANGNGATTLSCKGGNCTLNCTGNSGACTVVDCPAGSCKCTKQLAATTCS